MSNRAFSLVELLIVVAILAILAAFVVPRFTNATTDSKVSAMVSDLRAFQKAVQMYATENSGKMPLSNSELKNGVQTYLYPGATDRQPAVGGMYGFHSWVTVDVAAIGIWGSTDTTGFQQAIDDEIDDGNLTTGRVRSGPSNGFIFFCYGDISGFTWP